MGLVILQLALKITSCFYILNMSMFFIIIYELVKLIIYIVII